MSRLVLGSNPFLAQLTAVLVPVTLEGAVVGVCIVIVRICIVDKSYQVNSVPIEVEFRLS